MVIDPAVPADAARVLRVPFTKNYGKDGTVKDVVLINDELYTYDFDEIVSCFGEVATSENKENALDLKNNRKKLTDEEKQSLGLDKYEHTVLKSSQTVLLTEPDAPKSKTTLKTSL
jgi:hypothetical protein